MWINPWETADLVTFTKETLHGRLYFCKMSALIYSNSCRVPKITDNIEKHCYEVIFLLLEDPFTEIQAVSQQKAMLHINLPKPLGFYLGTRYENVGKRTWRSLKFRSKLTSEKDKVKEDIPLFMFFLLRKNCYM